MTPFAGTGAAGREEDRRRVAPRCGRERNRTRIVRDELFERGAVAQRSLEADLQQSARERAGREVVGPFRVRHDGAGAADLERVVDLAGRVAVVQGRGDEPGTEAREVVHEEEDPVRHQRRDPVARLEAEARVVAGQAIGGVLELAPRHLVDRARHRHRVGLGVEADAEEVAQVDRCGEWASLERHPASCSSGQRSCSGTTRLRRNGPVAVRCRTVPPMGTDHTGSRVLVTGASSGIGMGLAEEFARRGAVLAISGRDRERLAATAAACRAHGATVHELVADLGDPAAVDRLAADTLTALGGVDVLVNNAGIPKRRHTRELDAATIDTVMQVNFLGPIRLTLALLPQMLERGGGQLVNVSSVAATLSSPGEAAYDASKAALSVFSEAMAMDLWGDNIKVLVVYPGVVDTPLFTLPDNDPFTAPVEFITVGELVQETFAALDRGALEVYIPAYFKDYVTGKANDVEGFVAGTAEYMRQQAAGTA